MLERGNGVPCPICFTNRSDRWSFEAGRSSASVGLAITPLSRRRAGDSVIAPAASGDVGQDHEGESLAGSSGFRIVVNSEAGAFADRVRTAL
mgnify:CR=1 FL=1